MARFYSLVTTVVVILSCGPFACKNKQKGAAYALSNEGVGKSKNVSNIPKLVELVPEANGLVEDDCPAESVTHGILDYSSSMYERIEYRVSPFFVEENASLRKSNVDVRIVHGGCAHFGTKYTVVFSKEKLEWDTERRIRKAIGVVKGLKLRPSEDGAISAISEALLPWLDAKNELSICAISDGVTTTVYCGIVEVDDKVEVSMSFDNAL